MVDTGLVWLLIVAAFVLALAIGFGVRAYISDALDV